MWSKSDKKGSQHICNIMHNYGIQCDLMQTNHPKYSNNEHRWCNLSSRAQEVPKLTQNLGGGIAMYSIFWIGIYGLLSVLISDFSGFNSMFVLFQWQICLVSDEICLVSSLALSGVSLNGNCMTVNWGSVAMEQRMNGYSVEYGSFFSPNWIVIQRSRGKSVDCPSQLILISLPSLVWKEDMKMVAISSLKKWTKERRRFWRKAIFPAKTTQRWKILLNLESKCISLD